MFSCMLWMTLTFICTCCIFSFCLSQADANLPSKATWDFWQHCFLLRIVWCNCTDRGECRYFPQLCARQTLRDGLLRWLVVRDGTRLTGLCLYINHDIGINPWRQASALCPLSGDWLKMSSVEISVEIGAWEAGVVKQRKWCVIDYCVGVWRQDWPAVPQGHTLWDSDAPAAEWIWAHTTKPRLEPYVRSWPKSWLWGSPKGGHWAINWLNLYFYLYFLTSKIAMLSNQIWQKAPGQLKNLMYFIFTLRVMHTAAVLLLFYTFELPFQIQNNWLKS